MRHLYSCIPAVLTLAVLAVGAHRASAQGSAIGNPSIACFKQPGSTTGSDVVVMDIDGTHQTVIASLPTIHTTGLSWSPDLDPVTPGYQGKIVYGIISAPWTLWAVDIQIANGSFSWGQSLVIPLDVPHTNPVSTRFDAMYPAWSPDGKWVALHGDANGNNVTNLGGIWVIPWTDQTLTSTTTPIHLARGWYPAWNWDPNRTVDSIASSFLTDLVAQAVVLPVTSDLAGSPVSIVTNAFPNDNPARIAWGSQGIAFCGATVTIKGKTQTTTTSLYLLNPATAPAALSSLRPIPGTAGLGDPSWSLGDAYLISTSSSGIVRVDPITGTQTMVAPNPRKASFIGPDCRRW